MARAQSVLALDLAERGIVDRIIPELPDAADEPEEFCHRVGGVIEAELAALMATGPGSPEARAARYA
jgi:acetyl-CoA carboxylase carboxyl transferase subunit beta